MSNPIRDGKEAERLLAEIEDHLKEVRQLLTEQWGHCRTTEEREELWYTLRGVELFEGRMSTVIQNGIIAQQDQPS